VKWTRVKIIKNAQTLFVLKFREDNGGKHIYFKDHLFTVWEFYRRLMVS